MNPVIQVDEICKDYRLGVINRTTFRDEMLYHWKRILGRDPKADMGQIGDARLEGNGVFHALDHVSFQVEEGETIGLIGRNGAGKSTMLKILSRITSPSSGQAVIRGRVGSLLEVGTGFHPELTGRENIFMNGAILGMKKREIVSKFDEIVAFSEIADFLDTPVKRYSSGMYVKLAFAVASSLDTDVLLVDEVLAVGDASFQKKSLARMRELTASGRTVVFVSHSMENIRKICSRCILFEDGRIAMDGAVENVTQAYLARNAAPGVTFPRDVGGFPLAVESVVARIEGDSLRVESTLSSKGSLSGDVDVTVVCRDSAGNLVMKAFGTECGAIAPPFSGNAVFSTVFERVVPSLNGDVFTVDLCIHEKGVEDGCYLVDLAKFELPPKIHPRGLRKITSGRNGPIRTEARGNGRILS